MAALLNLCIRNKGRLIFITSMVIDSYKIQFAIQPNILYALFLSSSTCLIFLMAG